MSETVVRPATPVHAYAAASRFPDLLADRWRPGGNRRSFVLVRPGVDGNRAESTAGADENVEADTVFGHCRGIDNAVHPASRVFVIETVAELRGTAAERELLAAQVAVSTRSLEVKLTADSPLLDLIAGAGGVLVQLMPPWRYTVGPATRAWAQCTLESILAGHAVVPASQADPSALLDLEVDHYIAQHETWVPAAPREELRALLAPDHDPDSEDTWNRNLSRAVVDDHGNLLAAALVFGDAGDPEEPPELVHLSRPYASDEAWENKLIAIAAVIRDAPDGSVLCIDSHLGMREEYARIGQIPGADRDGDAWTAIVAIPVPGGPTPIPLDPALIPDAAAWARRFTADTHEAAHG